MTTIKKTTLALAILALCACSKSPNNPPPSLHEQADNQVAINAVSPTATDIPAPPVVPVSQEEEKPTKDNKQNQEKAKEQQTKEQQDNDTAIIDNEPTNPSLANKRLIINSDLRFEVADVRQTVNYVQALANAHSGYIAQESVQNQLGRSEQVAIGDGKYKEITEYTPIATVTVRVPKKEVTAFLQNLQTRIVFLFNSTMDAKDATLDIKKAQIEAQIADLKAKKINELPSDNSTNPAKIDAQLSVANSLAQASLEQLNAEIAEQVIADQVELATLHLDFFEHAKLHTRTIQSLDSQIAKERQGSFISRLVDSVAIGGAWALELLLVVARLWVLWAIGAFVWFGLPKLKQKYQKPAQAPTPPPSDNQPNQNP